jgi:response regulator RpfG family c-di-GMP phosphodiesterase
MSLTPTASDKPTVLIVDDERFNLSALHALLRDDCRVMVATDGELGLTAARANLPDLILLDVTMPGISGHDVCRALKEDPATQSIPIIFITALVDADEVLDLQCERVEEFLERTFPYSACKLLSSVNGRMRFRIDTERARMRLAQVFALLEQHRDQLCIGEYAISQASLEQGV